MTNWNWKFQQKNAHRTLHLNFRFVLLAPFLFPAVCINSYCFFVFFLAIESSPKLSSGCNKEWLDLCHKLNKTCHINDEDVPQCGACLLGFQPFNGKCLGSISVGISHFVLVVRFLICSLTGTGQ